mmetsp:Transcript_4517/g.7827  ORF Transcript_4517/g.7827 Transcript_4517/m.7827 type:complete len:118 (-) Transcript_4517:130-483(-)
MVCISVQSLTHTGNAHRQRFGENSTRGEPHLEDEAWIEELRRQQQHNFPPALLLGWIDDPKDGVRPHHWTSSSSACQPPLLFFVVTLRKANNATSSGCVKSAQALKRKKRKLDAVCT